MNKMKLWLIMTLGLLCSIHSWAYGTEEFEHEGFMYTFISDGNAVEMVGCTSKQVTSVNIPSKIVVDGKEYPVTSLGIGAFYSCYHLESVEIPNTIDSIKLGAFRDTKLHSVTLPNSVKYIGQMAFENCKSLSSVEISSSVDSIYCDAFVDCDYLNTITVDPKNETFDSRDNCNAIIETKTNTLVVACSASTIPSTVTAIGKNAFAGMEMESFKIPNTIVRIEDDAFSFCYHLKSLELPESLEYIGAHTFGGCRDLLSVNIPKNVSYIGTSAFSYCSNLAKITVDPENAYYESPGNTNAIIERKSNKLIKGSNNTIIPNTVTEIGDGAFASCQKMKFIKIPNSVTTIGESAFSMCLALEKIELSENLTSIEGGLFHSCSALTSVTIPNKVKYIGDEAFHSCDALESVDIPYSVSSIGTFCFSHCEKLKSVSIPYAVEDLDPYTFVFCESLETVTLPNFITADYTSGAVLWNVFQGLQDGKFEVDNPRVLTADDNGYVYFHSSGVAVVTITGEMGGKPFKQQRKFIVGGYPLTIKSTGLATFSAPSPYEVPASLEVGTVKVANNNANATFSSPKSCYSEKDAVILKGAPGEYFIHTPVTAPDDLEKCLDNDLKPAYIDGTIQAASGCELFVLSDGDKGLGFYYQMGCPDGSSIVGMKGKAYLELPFAQANLNGLRLVENDATAIEEVTVENADAEIYTLTGVRLHQSVDQLPKGLYIVNGKKVMVK